MTALQDSVYGHLLKETTKKLCRKTNWDWEVGIYIDGELKKVALYANKNQLML